MSSLLDKVDIEVVENWLDLRLKYGTFKYQPNKELNAFLLKETNLTFIKRVQLKNQLLEELEILFATHKPLLEQAVVKTTPNADIVEKDKQIEELLVANASLTLKLAEFVKKDCKHTTLTAVDFCSFHTEEQVITVCDDCSSRFGGGCKVCYIAASVEMKKVESEIRATYEEAIRNIYINHETTGLQFFEIKLYPENILTTLNTESN